MSYGSVAQWLEDRIGGGFDDIPGNVEATTTEVKILSPSGDRWAVQICNNGSNPVQGRIEVSDGTSFLFLLAQDGSMFWADAENQLSLPTRAFYIATTTGTSDVSWVETRKTH